MARHERPPARRTVRYWLAVVWTCWWAGLTLMMLAMSVSQWAGWEPVLEGEAPIDGVFGALVTSALAVGGIVMARGVVEDTALPLRPAQPPRIQAGKRHPLPRPGSAARQPMRRLRDAEGVLAELLRRLGDLPDEPTVPDDVIERTWRVATATATSLRSVAARLEAVELAVAHAPAPRRAALEDGAGSLRTHLDQGVDGYLALIGAVGQVLLASTPALATAELVETTEHLAGLAEALDELSG